MAMRLHTKDQAPKEGQKPADNPWQKVCLCGLLRHFAGARSWCLTGCALLSAVAADARGVPALPDRVEGGL